MTSTEKPQSDNELDLFSLIRLLYHYKWSLTAFVVAFGVAGIIYITVSIPVYTATSTILPAQDFDSSSQLSQLQNLASNIPFLSSMEGSSVSDLFPQFLTSKKLLYQLMDSSFTTSTGEKISLLEFLEIEEEDPLRQRELAYEELTDLIDVSEASSSNLLVLSITLKDPVFAAEVCNKLTAMLNDFSILYKTTAARNTLEFAQEQLKKNKDSLDVYSDKVREFVKGNIGYLESPDLLMEFRGLEMERQARERIWIDYRAQVAMAEFQQVKDTPHISVLDEALVPTEPSAPRKLLLLAVSLVMGFILGCISVIIVDKMRTQ